MDQCQTHGATKEAVCATCFEQICYACAFDSHSDHRIIQMKELDNELHEVTKNLRIEISSCEDKLEMLRVHIKTQERERFEKSEYELQSFIKSAKEQFRCQKQHFEALCKAADLSNVSEDKHFGRVFEEVENFVNSYYKTIPTVLQKNHLSRLQDLNEWTSKVATQEVKLDECSKHVMKCSIKNQIRPASLSAKVAVLTKGKVLGAIKLPHNQMIIIRNYNQEFKNYIHCACLSSDTPNTLFWDKAVEIAKDPPMIVMINSLVLKPQSLRIVVGFERKLLVVELKADDNLKLLYESSTTQDLKIPVNSHITGISVVSGELHHKGIITTDSASEMFHIFDTNFKLLGKLKCASGTRVLACSLKDDEYKIAACVNSLSASILRGNLNSMEVTCVGKIEDTDHSREMFINSMTFDGILFSALWASKIEFIGDILQWSVVAYDRDGLKFQVSLEGECEADVRPVSLSNVGSELLLSFSDGSVRECRTLGQAVAQLPEIEQLANRMQENPLALLKGFQDFLRNMLQ